MAVSMTGYGKSTCQINERNIHIEIKALNSKSFDLFLKLPQFIREKESQIRSILAKKIIRGKVELIVTFDTNESCANFNINKTLFKQYYKTIRSTAEELDAPLGDSLISSVLRIPDVLSQQTEEFDSEKWEIFKTSLEDAIQQLISFRVSEGEHMKKDINNSIIKIQSLLDLITPHENERIENIKQKLSNSLSKIQEKIQIDTNRFEQELVYYLEKLDINEEKVRLAKHLEYFKETIENEQGSGKKLGFISQEIGREINTLGSKAQHAEIQKIIVQMKDELEKIKEQLMNVL